MRLTIHRGTHEIGGSCVELATAATRIVLDVGLPLVKADRQPFDQRSIEGKSIDTLIKEGILPRIPGLFDHGDPPDAILLTHSHLDHSGLLHLSRPKIPIYASRGTSKMMLATAVFSRQQELDRGRYRQISDRQPFDIGDFHITPYAVDHSSFGSMAFLIEAEGTSVLYPGDLRMHGRKPGMMQTLLREVAPKQVNVLLMEGTHFGSTREQGITEYELEDQIIEHIRSAPGIILAAFSPVDLDRLVTYYRAAQRTGRTFVADAYTAFILHLTASEARVPRPTTEAGIRGYFNRAFERRNIENPSRLFEPDRIALADLLAHPDQFLMVFRPSMTELDFGDTLPDKSRVLFSYWAGYLTSPDWTQLRQQVAAVGGDFIPAHASGHIYITDIIEFVQAVNPKLVVPIHTFEPERFRDHFANSHLLADGEPFAIPLP